MSCIRGRPAGARATDRSHNHRLPVTLIATLHVASSEKFRPLLWVSSYDPNYLFRPLQVLNLNEPIRVDQLKLPVIA